MALHGLVSAAEPPAQDAPSAVVITHLATCAS